jgi:hypothetical protein
MSLVTALSSAVEKIITAVESGVKDVDGEALAEARRLIALAKDAESGVLSLVTQYKTDLEDLIAKIPDAELRQALTDLVTRLVADLTGLFGDPAE